MLCVYNFESQLIDAALFPVCLGLYFYWCLINVFEMIQYESTQMLCCLCRQHLEVTKIDVFKQAKTMGIWHNIVFRAVWVHASTSFQI